MERYNEYKPTSVQWLKEIPSHWEVVPLKRCLNAPLMYGANEAPDGEDLNLPRYIRITDIDEHGMLKSSTYKSLSREKAAPYMLQKGDLLFARSGATVGKSYIFEETTEACFAGYLIKAHCTNKLLPKFLFRYTQSDTYDLWKNSIFIQSTIPNIGADKYSILPIPLPPLAEQEKIVSYLDSKTSKIDAYVADKEKEIQLLQELKQKTIAEAVTKGLNPNVKMKDCGISWIGMIPEHWDVRRAKFMFIKNKRNRRPEDEVITCFRDGQVTLRKNRRLTGFTESEKYEGYQGIRKGDLVIHQMDAFAGSIGVSDSDGMGTSVYHCCTPIGDYNVYYYAFLIRQMAMSGFIQSLYKGIRERSSDFSFPVFGNQYLVVPPRTEQNAIVAYIEEKCQKVDTLITELQAEIDNLKEYKQRLIADVVTGQVNVQNEI